MKNKLNLQKSGSQFFEYLNVVLATIVIFGILLYLQIYKTGGTSDYGSHILWAQGIVENFQAVPKESISHAAWQWGVIAIHTLVGHSWQFAAFVITLGSMVFTIAFLYWWLRKKASPLLAGSCAIGLMLVAPIFVLDPFTNLWFMVNGYIGANVYHNPTYLLLKPLALLQTYFSLKALTGEKSNWKSYILPIVCSLLAVYTKPNFALILLPAVSLIAVIRLARKKPVDWKKLLFGIFIPTVLMLGWQYWITYAQGSNSGVVIDPFIVMSHYSSNLVIKLILSLVFPLVVLAVYRKRAFGDIRIQLGWLLGLVGLVLTYFFAESGPRTFSANFLWSGEISVFILFVCSLLFLMEHKFDGKVLLEKWLVLASGLLHTLFGLVYYFYIFYSVLQGSLLH